MPVQNATPSAQPENSVVTLDQFHEMLDTQKAAKITIPRSVVELIELEPSRFGFESEDLQKRFKAGIAQRKASVLKRQPGGLSQIARGPYATITSGRTSRYSGTSAKLNSDPDLYKKGPVLRPRSLEEALEIYTVLYRALAFLRLRRDGENANNLHVRLRKLRTDILIPMWHERRGVFNPRLSDDAYHAALEESRAEFDEWALQVRRESNQIVSAFEHDLALAGLPVEDIEQRATCILKVPRALVLRSYMWANDPLLTDDFVPNVWDRILERDRDHSRKGPTVELTNSELNEVAYHLGCLVSTFMNNDERDLEISDSDWLALVKMTHEVENRLQSMQEIVALSEN